MLYGFHERLSPPGVPAGYGYCFDLWKAGEYLDDP
jgi:hypothetical protein